MCTWWAPRASNPNVWIDDYLEGGSIPSPSRQNKYKDKNMNLFRQLPKIDKLINDSSFDNLNKHILTTLAKEYIDNLREDIKNNKIATIVYSQIIEDLKNIYNQSIKPSLTPVINATGITVHTNLGSSLIDESIFNSAKDIVCNYCNLEYNLENGKRGDRYQHTTKALKELLNCEDALIVNNNAAAVFLILNTFAKDKESIVSRGELVEIGGSFRVPDVMSASGTKLVEVGTTNKTKISDYENAITDNTKLLMKVHKSNYTIEGFTQEADFKEISQLAKNKNIIDYYDLGSGYIPNLPWGLSEVEPSITKLLEYNPSIISFSGDKLFGSVQAGIIVGKKELISKLKKNQLLRMFRVDKVTLALLEQTILAYKLKNYDSIPTVSMLSKTIEELKIKANTLVKDFKLSFDIKESKTYVGGGTMPNIKIPTVIIIIHGDAITLEKHFRENSIIGRIENDKFILDTRTLRDSDFAEIVKTANKI